MMDGPRTPVSSGPDYVIDTCTDLDGLTACARDLAGGRSQLLYGGLGCAALVVGVLLFALGGTTQGILCIILGVLAMGMRDNELRQLPRMQAERLRQRYHTDAVPQQMTFWPQGVSILNQISRNRHDIRYEDMALLSLREKYLYFEDVGKRWSILRLEDTVGTTGLLPYLYGKCVNAKKRGFTKETGRPPFHVKHSERQEK